MSGGGLILVNEDGEPRGEADESACHTGGGMLHLAFTVLLRDGGGDFIIQRRSADKRLWPLFWEASCSGHPRVGDDMVAAAAARTFQEMGLKAGLDGAGSFVYRAEYGADGVEWEVCHLLLGEVPSFSLSSVSPDPREVEEVRLVSPGQLMREMREERGGFAPWLFPAVELWKKVVRWGA